MTDLQSLIERGAVAAATRAFGESYADINLMVRPAANRQFGDYQADLAMGFGKRVGLAPREVAQRLVTMLAGSAWIDEVAVAGPSFINFRLQTSVLQERAEALFVDPRLGVELAAVPETIVVDYSSPPRICMWGISAPPSSVTPSCECWNL